MILTVPVVPLMLDPSVAADSSVGVLRLVRCCVLALGSPSAWSSSAAASGTGEGAPGTRAAEDHAEQAYIIPGTTSSLRSAYAASLFSM